MNFTVHTKTSHLGATIYERWKFPKPESKQEYVTLEVLDSDLGGSVISKTSVQLDDVPQRATDSFLDGATAYREALDNVIGQLSDEDDDSVCQEYQSPASKLPTRSKKDNQPVQLKDDND